MTGKIFNSQSVWLWNMQSKADGKPNVTVQGTRDPPHNPAAQLLRQRCAHEIRERFLGGMLAHAKGTRDPPHMPAAQLLRQREGSIQGTRDPPHIPPPQLVRQREGPIQGTKNPSKNRSPVSACQTSWNGASENILSWTLVLRREVSSYVLSFHPVHVSSVYDLVSSRGWVIS
ncbi:hypothetical protein SAMN05421877_112127 [Sphingobacterium lactis]|uniref:Uncharacterized protein n=1 Tax=Sphingobacterium lactis TaxID=797291 RepID=A0A1H6C125_9SPHI|nr:hypothetical protein SAMN05421877_112127 [Sphingobacterium lactis]